MPIEDCIGDIVAPSSLGSGLGIPQSEQYLSNR